jgi:hypothetical protein
LRLARSLETSFTQAEYASVIYTTGGSTMLSVLQRDGRAITIQVPPNISITELELIRFAAGVRVTSAAVAGKG